jgi:hypothetical protein
LKVENDVFPSHNRKNGEYFMSTGKFTLAKYVIMALAKIPYFYHRATQMGAKQASHDGEGFQLERR